MTASHEDTQAPPRTLAGATILQIVPALREEPVARTALDVARALLASGARALIAAEEGPLVEDLRAAGGEWISLVNSTKNPLRLRGCTKALERLIASERVDIIQLCRRTGDETVRLAARAAHRHTAQH